ncbi:septum site-determining protein MinC [Ferroacidibacillus organovorans]|uniref:Probable septum site-determining protein MinC n=1 Tax=Ferroacidibacillus organovorans TaxID=1765683 RepID=A0A162TBI1_9BACL|nr:septum site-determining protein MinC [Ferroacidibacillus organovorans]KYP80643.1 hypothetical protein AYJ22_10720 [Ferroacidibacillus organovorans]OAG94329.1 hypothetical protein AYW79_06255 [Ferroacidibacillus organovorans]OPG16429.1 hypothetical protein B2M26_06005 [Ferroacidibacillus organovorans]
MSRFAMRPSATTIKETVSIKGIRNGLLFTLRDDVPFRDVLSALEETLRKDASQGEETSLLTAYVQLGNRILTDEEERELRHVIAAVGTMMVGGLEGAPKPSDWMKKEPFVFKGTVRSGQVIEHDGDIVIIGDVNPGARLISTGDVYVMGVLRGAAHAGAAGDRDAVVAAAYFQPLQIRIADVVRRAPEGNVQAAEMEFAYLREGEQMAVERMNALIATKAHRRNRRVSGQGVS